MPPPSQRTMVVSARTDAVAGKRSRAVLTTAGKGETARVLILPESGMVSLGRSSSCTYRFEEASVSSVHARIAQVSGQFIFTDNGSTNGSFVNDARVTEPVVLKEGDRIRLGPNYLLRFSLVDPDEEEALKRMHEAALIDGLTRVFNRKHLEERLDAEVAFANRHKTELVVIVLDIDYFKRVNDTYGHQAGDAVLKHIAQIVQNCLRAEDVLARYGGEEFVVVARGINLSQGCAFADRLRLAIARSSVNVGSQDLQVTASLGVASIHCCTSERTKTAFFEVADSRLYRAKEGGRNRVVGWPEE